MNFIVISKRNGDKLLSITLGYQSALEIPPEEIEDLLESLDTDYSIKEIEVYELKNPVTYEKHISYTINQG